MLISKGLQTAINDQIGREFGAAMQYVNIASYFTAGNMLMFGKLFFKQADEEIGHGMKFVRYVLDAGGRIGVPAIPVARADFKSPEDAVAAALKWEEGEQQYRLAVIKNSLGIEVIGENSDVMVQIAQALLDQLNP